MRRRLSTLVPGDGAVVNHSGSRGNACAHHGTRVPFQKEGAQKRKTRRWERRVRSFCYRSLRFQVCGLAVARLCPKARSGLFLLSSQLSVLVLLLSCSSLTFRNLTEPFAKSHRFLSVAHSLVPGWGRPIVSKTRAE